MLRNKIKLSSCWHCCDFFNKKLNLFFSGFPRVYCLLNWLSGKTNFVSPPKSILLTREKTLHYVEKEEQTECSRPIRKIEKWKFLFLNFWLKLTLKLRMNFYCNIRFMFSNIYLDIVISLRKRNRLIVKPYLPVFFKTILLFSELWLFL